MIVSKPHYYLQKLDFHRPFPCSDQLSLCGSLGGWGPPPALSSKRATCAKTALGCRQNDWQQISGHQRICRKSIICQHSTCMFGVVKCCTQTDSCVSMGLQRGYSADGMVWYEKTKAPFKTTQCYSSSHRLVRRAKRMSSLGGEDGNIIWNLQWRENKMPFQIQRPVSLLLPLSRLPC